MKALHFGAGNIGRGFIGQLLAQAGLDLTFADVDDSLLAALNARGGYPVRIVGESQQTQTISGVRAVNSASDAVLPVIVKADLITTAVGPTVLARIAPTLAKGLLQRRDAGNTRPLNIIACENSVCASSQLREHVLAALPGDAHTWLSQQVGFVDSAVDRIVPPAQSPQGDPLEVTVETFCEWIVDQTQFHGAPPSIPGMELTDNLLAFVERKLFTLNTGHAITAYLGKLAGHSTIRQAISDPAIRAVVAGAMQESGAVLIRRYGFAADKHAAYIEKILTRFANPWLQDDVDRVGRQPLRKLSAGDRLIKPLLGTMEYGLPCDNLLRGIAAALRFRSDDPQAQELARLIDQHGVAAALSQASGLNASSPQVAQVVQLYSSL